jgi:hypothetical protein
LDDFKQIQKLGKLQKLQIEEEDSGPSRSRKNSLNSSNAPSIEVTPSPSRSSTDAVTTSMTTVNPSSSTSLDAPKPEKGHRKSRSEDMRARFSSFLSRDKSSEAKSNPTLPQPVEKPKEIFGNTLENIMKKQHKAHPQDAIPHFLIILNKMLMTESHLTTEGLFRVSGGATVVKALKQQIENGFIF